MALDGPIGNFWDTAASESLVESVLNDTPAFYSIVGEDYDVLYVSDNYAELMGKPRQELLSGKCYNMVDKTEQCHMKDSGGPLCPVARAFATGERQYSLINEDLRDRKLHFDNYAIPMELEGKRKEKVRCCLEILFDRSRERNLQITFENDLKQLVEKMSNMVEEILPEVSANAQRIIREASLFSEYLGSVTSGSPWRGPGLGLGRG
jgi:hypothetical protein